MQVSRRFRSRYIPATVRSALLGLILAAAPATARDFSLTIDVDRERIFLGESIQMSIKVTGASEPDLSAIQHVRSELVNRRQESYQNIQIINGRRQVDSFSGTVYTYRVTPVRAGSLRLGPVYVEHGNRKISRDGPQVRVDGMEEQDDVAIDIVATRDQVLLQEPFEIMVTIALRRLPGQHRDFDPMDPASPPELHLPHLEVREIPGLSLDTNIRDVLQKNLISNPNQPGFRINNFTVRRDPFSSFGIGVFMNEQPAVFALPRREITRNGQPYFEYTLTTRYTPTEERSHTFGPVTFKGQITQRVDPGGRAHMRRIFAASPQITVHVSPPPETGRPLWYTGAIGSNFHAQVMLDTQTCFVGDPLSMSLRISGNVTLENILPPSLRRQQELLEDFRVYDDQVETVSSDSTRTFTYTIRPLRAGTLEVPPLKLAYFDTHRREYVTVETAPLPVRAQRSPEMDLHVMLETSTNRVLLTRSRRPAELLPAPIRMHPPGYLHQSLALQNWQWMALLLPPLLFFVIYTTKISIRIWQQNRPAYRRRTAARQALRCLEDAKSPDTPEQRAVKAFRVYLGMKTGRPTAGITPTDAEAMLQAAKIPEAITNAFLRTFETCFNTAFAAAEIQPQPVVAEAKQHILAVDAAWEKTSS